MFNDCFARIEPLGNWIHKKSNYKTMIDNGFAYSLGNRYNYDTPNSDEYQQCNKRRH